MRDKHAKKVVKGNAPSSFQRNLADYLTFSRLVISFAILALALIGEAAYIMVIMLSFLGALTDIYDGRIARRYLSDGEEGKLGKHDIEIDTIFISSIIVYLAFSYIVISPAVGIIWIVLVMVVSLWTKVDYKILTVSEIVGVITILFVTLIYNPPLFMLLIVPGMIFCIFINRYRVSQLVFNKWLDMFSK